MSLSRRIWVACIALLLLATNTLFVIGSAITEHNLKASLPTLGLFAFIWVICIPLLIRLRQMMADQRLDRQ